MDPSNDANHNLLGEASGSKSPEAVLGEVLVNRRKMQEAVAPHSNVTTIEDEDLALAKMIQEQERAFMMLAGNDAAGGRYENVPPRSPPANNNNNATANDDDQDEQPLDDEEIARRLQEQEEAEFQQRLLALAGLVPGEEHQHNMDGNNFNSGDEDVDSDAVADPDNMSYEELTALGDFVGTVSTGLSEEQIQQAVEFEAYGACCKRRRSCVEGGGSSAGGRQGHEEDGEEQCTVCRVEFEDMDEVAILPCKHYYHRECIGMWLKQKKVCPQCNKEITVENKNTMTISGASGQQQQQQEQRGPVPFGERRAAN